LRGKPEKLKHSVFFHPDKGCWDCGLISVKNWPDTIASPYRKLLYIKTAKLRGARP
jgi:hypothetical protein